MSRLNSEQRSAALGVAIAFKAFWFAPAAHNHQRVLDLEEAFVKFENTMFGPEREPLQPEAPELEPPQS